MCCTFNMKPINEIFNGKSYVDLAMEQQSSDRNLYFMDTTVPEWFKQDKITQPGVCIFNLFISD
jgi:hypothetical protein